MVCKNRPFVARQGGSGGIHAAPTIRRKLAMYNFRGFVGRGLDPAAGTPRPTRFFLFARKSPLDVGAACTPPGDVPSARKFAGRPKPHGGVKPPPYRVRVRGCSTARSRQDKIARAACRPPLRPNGKQICRARVLTAPATSRQAEHPGHPPQSFPFCAREKKNFPYFIIIGCCFAPLFVVYCM